MAQNTSVIRTGAAAEDSISALTQAGDVVGALAGLGLAGIAGWLPSRRPAWLALAGASLTVLAGVFWIFRNPERSITGEEGIVVAPCDGEVTGVAPVQEPDFLRAPAYCITLRVRPGDVQVLRAPVAGVVRHRRYVPAGQSGGQRDVLWLGLRQPAGSGVLLKMGVSALWRAMPSYVGRRITVLIDLEDTVRSGQICGHLPLGGEVQVYTTAAAQLAVQAGARVRAGETILASF